DASDRRAAGPSRRFTASSSSVRDPGAVSAVERGMKKRSMLAIASLATGFVVAAVTPSHALGEDLAGLSVDDTLSTLARAEVASDRLAPAAAVGQDQARRAPP